MNKVFNGSKVMIMTCSNCNNNCKHCYINYKGNFEGNRLFDLCSKLMKKYEVLINGTEVILHKEYFDAIQLVKYPCIITNGLELYYNPNIVNDLVRCGIKYVGLSYHFGIQEDISKVTKEIIQSDIDLLNANGLIPEIRVTLTKKNYKLIKNMCLEAYNMRAKGIKFTNYMPGGISNKLDALQCLNDSEIKNFFVDLNNVRKSYKKEEFNIRRCGTFSRNEDDDKKFKCLAYNDMVIVTPDLSVYPCIFLIDEKYKIGYIENDEIVIEREFENDSKECVANKVLKKIR